MIELRSDTFTLPTQQMREAMVTAPLGDDVYGEDPTVRELEEFAAESLGKAAACLMPSGTMANLASILTHCPRGAKLLVGAESDIYLYEAAGAAVCGGIGYEPLPTQADGRILLSDLAAGFPDDPEDPQFALPALICLENTHNRSGGSVLPLDYLRGVQEFARHQRVGLHLDGARIFNAAVALRVPAADIARYADSVQFCLSKGLSAPIGSIVTGDDDFIGHVRRTRKLLGGGMRQAGVIAAAGLVALRHVDRLAEDHENASILAKGLADTEGVALAQAAVQTNIVIFTVTDTRFTPESFLTAAARNGLRIAELGRGRIRAVTHSGISAADAAEAVRIIRGVIAEGP